MRADRSRATRDVFFSSRRRHTRYWRDWSSDVCSSDLCARSLTFSWGGNPGVGSLHRLRNAVENGWPHPLELIEHSHAGMAAAWAAGASNLPFGVLRGYRGTDLHAPAIITCPFTGEELAAVPAHRPDVGIVHAHRAAGKGNTELGG